MHVCFVEPGLRMGLFDGLTKGLETMIGAEEASGPNIAPKVNSIDIIYST